MATLEAGAVLNVSVVPAAFNVKAVEATPILQNCLPCVCFSLVSII